MSSAVSGVTLRKGVLTLFMTPAWTVRLRIEDEGNGRFCGTIGEERSRHGFVDGPATSTRQLPVSPLAPSQQSVLIPPLFSTEKRGHSLDSLAAIV
jgi:hypothetical protein